MHSGVFLPFGFVLTIALKLQLRITAVYPLHLLVLVDNKENGRIGVHEPQICYLNLELPESDHVLRSGELKEKQAVLLRGRTFVSGAHRDEELILNGSISLYF